MRPLRIRCSCVLLKFALAFDTLCAAWEKILPFRLHADGYLSVIQRIDNLAAYLSRFKGGPLMVSYFLGWVLSFANDNRAGRFV
jgi:hypothetical protein